jgi:hypothetical protein
MMWRFATPVRHMIDFNDAMTWPEIVAKYPFLNPDQQRNTKDIKQALTARAPDFVRWLMSSAIFPRHGKSAIVGDVTGAPGLSLSITLTGPMAGLWRDYATDEHGDLIELYAVSMGLTSKSDFPRVLAEISEFLGASPPRGSRSISDKLAERAKQYADKPRPNIDDLPPPCETYPYRRASDGNVIALVWRYEFDELDENDKPKKTFRAWNVATHKKEMPTPRPLYNLPLVIEANEVVFVEGERKVDWLKAKGIVATCVMGGCKASLDKCDLNPVNGKLVTIWPDNDKGGHELAERIAPRLVALGCTIRVVQIPPDRTPTWDCVDCIRDGGDPSALIKAALPFDATRLQLAEMNEKYSVVQDGGKVDVLMFERHAQPIGKYNHVRFVPAFLSFTDFRNLHCNRNVFVKEIRKGVEVMVPMPLGAWWLKHPQRRQYEGLTFQPGGVPVVDGRLNLWRGFGAEPLPGDWSLLRKHIREVLATGNPDSDTYIMNWIAWGVQHPDQRAEVALVFKGKRGTGKGTLGNTLVRLFGQHGVQISNAKYLTGFNAHLRDACFLFADEAYWPGDKSAEGDFKRLITEPSLFIEGKGRDAVTSANKLHVMMASNEDWIVPAGERERRYAAFDVSEKHIQEEKYFDPLYAQLENGGYGAMLHDLLQHDVNGWHPRRLPKNNALLAQQQRSLSPLDSWWAELLETGTLEGADPDAPNRAVSNEYQREISSTGFGARYVRQPGLFDQARSIEPRLKHHTSDHALGRHLTEQGCDNTKKVLRRRGWTFPPLPDCRKRWEARFPGWAWRDLEIEAWRFVDQDDEPPGGMRLI